MGIKKTNILVTGGAGFIGSHLVEKLVDLGAETLVIDIKIDPKSYFAINNLEKRCKFSFVDIRDKKSLHGFFANNKIDYVFHLAAEPIVEQAFNNPVMAFETNVMGTVNILEEVRKHKQIKGVIAASSDKAYGKLNKNRYSETDPLRGDHPYDVSKSCMDLICQTYYKTYNTPVIITRFGNVYGEGDANLSRIIPGICGAIAKNATLEIRSDGTYVRDYLYVKDVVEGYLLLMENFDKCKGEAFNFSSKDSLSVINLLKLAKKVLKTKIKYKILNIARNEIPYQHLSDLKIKKLGWRNNYSIDLALPSIHKWYSNNKYV
jgi:CDP-glucose 4,6-dehydratase